MKIRDYRFIVANRRERWSAIIFVKSTKAMYAIKKVMDWAECRGLEVSSRYAVISGYETQYRFASEKYGLDWLSITNMESRGTFNLGSTDESLAIT